MSNQPNLSIPAKSVTDHGQLTGLADDDHTIYLLVNGSRPLSSNWDAGSFQIRAETFQSDVTTGTAPLIVASTTVVTNLNADLLDGNHASAFAAASHTHSAADITSGTLPVARGGTGATTLTNGGILLGTGTSAIHALGVLGDGVIVVGDGTTDPTTLAAFTSSTGTLKHESGGIEADISAGDGFVQVKAGAGSVIKTNHAATAAPGTGNDNTQGYAIGSRWIDTTNDKEYVALDVSTGAAVWTETTGGGGGAATINDLTDVTITTLGDNEVLFSASGVWINQTLAEAGISAVGHTHDLAEVLTAGNDAEGNDVDNLGLLNFDAATELTMSAGSITITQSVHTVDTEMDASTDDLDTINGDVEGDFLLLYRANAAREVVVKHNSGNIFISSGLDFAIPVYGFALLYRDGASWRVNDPTAGDYGGGGGVTDHGALDGLTDDDHPQYLLANGSRALSADWDAGSFEVRAQTFESDVTTGTAPLTIASTTAVANLNADMVDGVHASSFVQTTRTITAGVALAGGGDLSANRTLDLDITELTADASPDGAADYVVTYDASAAAHKKVLLNNLPGASISTLNSLTDVTITSVADNEVLAYDSGSGTWINQTASEAGLATANAGEFGTRSTLTVASGAVTVTGHFHALDTESAAATDDLDTINGGSEGWVVVFQGAFAGRVVTAKHNTGNIILDGQAHFAVDSNNTLILIKRGSTWYELGRCNVSAASSFLRADGSVALTANWDVGSFQVRAQTFNADVTTGTAPLTITSTTVCTNLNADMVDGLHIASLLQTSGDQTASGNKTFSGKTKASATYGDITADSDGATITFDMNASNVHTVTLGGNRTLAVSNVSVGQRFIIRLVQDGTGSRIPTWFTTIKWPGGIAPTLTTTASKTDVFGFLCTSSGNYDGFVIGQNL